MQKGFTLIELLITVALIALIIGMALPMTAAWIDGPDVTKSVTNIEKALAKAKNIAVREGRATQAGAATSAICANNSANRITITVLTQGGVFGDAARSAPQCPALNSPAPNRDASGVIYQATLPEGVSVKVAAPGAADYSCTCFGSSGEIDSTYLNCNNCTNIGTRVLTVSKGSENAQLPIF